ncbi:TNF receptor-associated factor family protein DDB_G0267744-like [Lolium rigidum]|uniref:TNF receptor-associated factor family protein DDB_G0267744-like n=1 Tax=Lolium rigidum TaxID=89674 RepID=UPI001F5D0FA7|nr:TNF receptor-associated factor family protein DDB_G0267744-like [Lolium rigidum]
MDNLVDPEELVDTEEGKLLKFQCNLCDTEVVHSMTQLLLQALATASVDKTTGDIFKSPSSVAGGMKTELAGYMIQRCEPLPESMDGHQVRSDQLTKASTLPTEFLSDLVDDFVTSKRNMMSHVSGFFSSESRLNKIKDFVQKLETENVWAEDERKATTDAILRKIDVKCTFHCPERFDTPEKLAEHESQCKFRIVNCTNDGCAVSCCAVHIEKHDSICPFKLLPCEQLCEQQVMRSKMDKHCETVCPMKLINCPFYGVGCETAFAQCSLDRHCSGFLQTHLMYVVHVITRQGASVNDMDQRLQLLEKVQSLNELSGALDVRTLTLVTKEQESKINKLEKDLKAQETKMKKLENDLRSRK